MQVTSAKRRRARRADPRRREEMVERGRVAREEKRAERVNAARDSVLDALDEETGKLAWAAERDLLLALKDDLELRISDNDYRSPRRR